MLNVPYTGCDAESSRIAFDKLLTKQSCMQAGVPTARFLVVNSPDTPLPAGFQPPLVVKPARQCSSVGLQFVEKAADWHPALAESLKFDTEVLVEEKIIGRETTVGILGDQVLPVVEVKPKAGNYDYQNKYTAGTTEYYCPAKFDAATTKCIQDGRFCRVQGRGRARLCARGRDGSHPTARRGAGSEHAARHDRDQPVCPRPRRRRG